MHRHGRSEADNRSTERSNDDARRITPEAVGGRILERVSREVGEEGYRRYFEHQTRVRLADGRVEVTVPTGFVADLIGRRYGESLRKAASAELGSERVEVAFRIDRGAFGEPGRTPGRTERSSPPNTGAGRPGARTDRAPVTTRYRLDDFEVGESNQLAYTAAVTLIGPECPRSASPLFIHGPCGVGKTHLLHGVAAAVRERAGGESVVGRVVYTTAEAFTNEYIMAVQGNRLPSFRSRYRGVALLCIDDVQFLRNKTATQAELMHTFDALDLGGSRVVLASDEHPRRVEKLSQALVSRFLAGMVVRLDAPEPALRARIVARLAAKRGLKIDEAGASLIAARCGGAAPSVRDIEGVLSRVVALRGLPGKDPADGSIGLVVIRRALGVTDQDVSPEARPVRPVRMTLIIDEVCRVLRVEPSELFGKGRHKRVVLARSMCSLLGRSLTTQSYPEIARALGRPNHSTVVTAVQRIQGQMAKDESAAPYLGSDLDGLSAELAGLSLRMLAQQIRNDILRTAPGA